MKKQLLLSMIVLLVCSSFTIYAQELTADELVARVEEKLLSIEDFSTMITTSQVQDKRIETAKILFKASQTQGLARAEVLEHWVFRGTILTVDQESMLVRNFTPILQQIIVSSLSDVGAEFGGVDITDVFASFDFRGLDVEILEVQQLDEGVEYIVELSGYLDHVQRIKINHQFIPYYVELFEDQMYIGSLLLEDIVLNPGFSKEVLTQLPEVGEIRF